MSIQKEFVLRYRSDGHVRFQIPAQVCEHAIATAVTAGLMAIDGVYRVNLYRSQHKLSIRFQESACNFSCLAKQLFALLTELEQQDRVTPLAEKKSKFAAWKEKTKAKVGNLKAARWAKEKVNDAKETVQAAKIIRSKFSAANKTSFFISEKAIIDFLNDVLVLYLIKTHWTHITQQWLLKPLKYRYELMAMSYMFFLLVRARKKK